MFTSWLIEHEIALLNQKTLYEVNAHQGFIPTASFLIVAIPS